MSLSIRKAAFTLCLHLSLSLIICVSLKASELTLEPLVGFNGLFQLGYPFPLRVTLTNLGRPLEGTLGVKIWKGGPSKGINPYPVYYRRDVFLYAQSQKSIQFTIDPDSISRPLTVSFSSPGTELSKEIDLRRHFSPSPLNLLLTENSVPPTVPLASNASVPLISFSISHLPSEARAYQGVSTIIFYEQSLRDLSKPQIAALETWLSSGGRMLILGSIHYALYQEPSMSRFLPVRVVGSRWFSSLPSLEKVFREKASPLRNLFVQDAKLIEGRVLMEERGTPILVEMSRGRGRVFYLSLDVGRPPVSHWDGLSLLFGNLWSSPEGGRSTLQTSWDESVFFQLLWNPSFISTYVPVRSFFLLLLFYLGGLSLLAWLWQQRRLPRRALVLSLLSLVVFSSFGGYLHFSRGGNIPDGVLVSSTLLESIPDGYVEAQSNVVLFSTQRRDYKLRVESGWSELEPVPRSGVSDDAALVVQEEGGSTGFIFPLREWDYRLFKIRSMARFPLRAELQNKGDHFLLRLTNLSTKDLTECWLVVSGQRFFLGDVRQGSSQLREFSASPADDQAKTQNRMDLRDIPFSDKTRELLIRYSFFPQDQGMSRWGSGAVLFFGWVNGAPRRVWVDDARVLAYDYTLFRTVIPLDVDGD